MSRRNNFDLLRLIAAACVFFSHCFAIYGRHEPPLISSASYKAITFGTLGVGMFFIISGYLIARSWDQTQNATRFIIKRALRIYPAIFLHVIIVCLLIAPLVTALPLSEYFAKTLPTLPLRLARGIFFLMTPLPGTFTHNPMAHVLNGSLWTLPYELLCYAILFICGMISKARHILLLLTGAYLIAFRNVIFFPHDTSDLAYLHIAFFLLGACCWRYRDKLRFQAVAATTCLICLLSLCLAKLYLLPLFLVSVTYLTLYAALQLRYLGNASRYGDFSYGVYLYAWPVQQAIGALLHFSPDKFALFMPLSAAATLLLAVISWLAVERPALRRKPA